MSKPFTLYGTHTSGPVYKVALALSLLGQEFSYRFVDFEAKAQRSPAYLELSRWGQVPALKLDDGRVLVQSSAILEYLADRFGRLGGANAQERQLIREWLYWDADKLAPGIYRSRAIARGKLLAGPEVTGYFRAAGEEALSVLEAHLDGRTWLVGGALSVADIAVYGVVKLAPQGGFDLAGWPNVAAFVGRVEAEPGWKPQSDLALPQDKD